MLVLGAPLFTKPAGWFSSRFADRSLANYAQYDQLAQALLVTRRPILALSGDVHFGRYATAKDDVANRAKLIEIAASPLALVDDAVGGKFEEAPAVSGRRRPRWAPQRGPHLAMERLARGRTGSGDGPFVTLGLHALGRGVSVRATAWKITGNAPRAVAAGWREFTLEEVV